MSPFLSCSCIHCKGYFYWSRIELKKSAESSNDNFYLIQIYIHRGTCSTNGYLCPVPPYTPAVNKSCYQLHSSIAAFFVPPVASFLPSLAAYWSAKVPTGQLRFAHSDLVVWYEQEISTQPTMMQPGYKRGHPVLKTVFTIKENLL